MRLAFVVQRYGPDVHGGAELECRLWCEHLAQRHHVEVITTCARDYLTWADHYAPGVEMINGVRVQRYPVDAPRDLDVFNAYTAQVFNAPHQRVDELEWMRLQGPYSTPLLDAIAKQRDSFDLFIFETYLYATTFFGLPLVQDKAVLVPTAHDEWTIRLPIFTEVFTAPRYLIFNTPAERAMLRRFFDIDHIPGSDIGTGIDLPSTPVGLSGGEPPFLLYVGRVHTSKSCEQLYDYFACYKQEHPGPLKLIFAGRADIELPEHPEIVMAGFVGDLEKQAMLDGCTLLVMPSAVESLSIVCLEAWAASKPTLVNAGSEVLREQTVRSGGGLYYRDYDSFAACLDLLLADAALRLSLGRQGRRFVERCYSWPVVEVQLERALNHAIRIIKHKETTT